MCLAIPGKLISVDTTGPGLPTGQASFGGAVRTVNLAFVPEAEVGDYVNVHAGVALGIISEADAEFVFSYLDQILDADDSGDEIE